MSELYPLKFDPILKDKIWGGTALACSYGKKQGSLPNIGESWEISAIPGNLSVVSNGYLAGNNIEEIIEVYMGDITGEEIYMEFGNQFPLLIKLIDARQDLSLQVHPGNEQAVEMHDTHGKTEMWYILQSEKNSKIYTGFSKPLTREIYIDALAHDELPGLLNVEYPEPGDTFFTPAGRIHAIGAGIVLAEIQQTSDITYRVHDWGRKDNNGKPRELQLDQALEVMDFNAWGKNKIEKKHQLNRPANLVKCEFFETNVISFDKPLDRDYTIYDSFVIYLCTAGSFKINWNGKSEKVSMGETVLLPAVISSVVLEPQEMSETLEIYINNYKPNN